MFSRKKWLETGRQGAMMHVFGVCPFMAAHRIVVKNMFSSRGVE